MPTPPNIIFIMADDHAAKAIVAYGHGINATPNIDRLAHEGMRLDHCYVSNSICAPSRASILTGVDGHVTYGEGLLIGYRHHDARQIAPLFPFGHGLGLCPLRLADAARDAVGRCRW